VETIRVGPTDLGVAPFDWHFTDPSPVGNPDLLLFDDILACLHAQYSVDLTRIWSTGHSAGASLASYLAMHRSNRLAAVAVLSGGLLDLSTAPEGYITPTDDIPILLTWGGETDTYTQSGANFVYNKRRLGGLLLSPLQPAFLAKSTQRRPFCSRMCGRFRPRHPQRWL
jgi:pimeloyl-ACP methyl ester carboxylesterase